MEVGHNKPKTPIEKRCPLCSAPPGMRCRDLSKAPIGFKERWKKTGIKKRDQMLHQLPMKEFCSAR